MVAEWQVKGATISGSEPEMLDGLIEFADGSETVIQLGSSADESIANRAWSGLAGYLNLITRHRLWCGDSK